MSRVRGEYLSIRVRNNFLEMLDEYIISYRDTLRNDNESLKKEKYSWHVTKKRLKGKHANGIVFSEIIVNSFSFLREPPPSISLVRRSFDFVRHYGHNASKVAATILDGFPHSNGFGSAGGCDGVEKGWRYKPGRLIILTAEESVWLGRPLHHFDSGESRS